MDEQNKTQPTQGNFMGNATTGSSKALIGGVIVVILVMIGNWYLMNGNATPAPVVTNETQMMEMDAATSEADTAKVTAALKTQSSSDELSAIDADLSATDMNSIGDPSKI